ncbi:putative F-box domain-containing protein [Helianthus annuus]|nr:putative F-box domain-containing protein [Helianthus annuus]KAJ0647738.1 putative F-box domain-containing protein [Helianthus annuus]KAJ0651604.1 putative F-box domain-containing protein [Helianthus annuus]
MAAELPFDVIEQLLVRLDVEDLIRCKSVCKSWQSLISCPRLVKAHLNHAYDNDRHNPQLGHRRFARYCITKVDDWLCMNETHLVGSCDGLVCFSPEDVEFVVINPSTREEKKLPTPPYRPNMAKIPTTRSAVCWGFGYDSYADDYKVVVGFRQTYSKKRTRFYVLSLKSNIWRVIGEEVMYWRGYVGIDGVLCGGALHWFMADAKKKVIISLDLSKEEFKEISLPTEDDEYKWNGKHRLGVIEECLCIYSCRSPLSTNKWVMKNNKWQLYNDHICEAKYDVAHHLTGRLHSSIHYYSHDDGTRVPCNGDYIRAGIFVKSLVSPYPHLNNYYERQKRNTKVQSSIYIYICLLF